MNSLIRISPFFYLIYVNFFFLEIRCKVVVNRNIVLHDYAVCSEFEYVVDILITIFHLNSNNLVVRNEVECWLAAFEFSIQFRDEGFFYR